MHDPRRTKPPSTRDIAALTFIGEGYEVAQYQLHAAIFPDLSAVVVSHFTTRAVRNGWIAVERWNRVGINRLRLTTLGRRVAIQGGADPDALFVPRRAVAGKDVAHTLWINDLRVVLRTAFTSFDAVMPAWHLQRRLVPSPAAIPDVLAISRGGDGRPPLVLACEIDLGGERLIRTFLPKLQILQGLMSAWSGGSDAQIVILTIGAQRAAAINRFAATTEPPTVAVLLPATSGRDAVTGVAEIIAPLVNATS